MLRVPCVWLTKLKKKYIKNYFLGGFFSPQKKTNLFFFSGPNISSHQPKYHNNKLIKMVDNLNITAQKKARFQRRKLTDWLILKQTERKQDTSLTASPDSLHKILLSHTWWWAFCIKNSSTADRARQRHGNTSLRHKQQQPPTTTTTTQSQLCTIQKVNTWKTAASSSVNLS